MDNYRKEASISNAYIIKFSLILIGIVSAIMAEYTAIKLLAFFH